jgi:hypothetical protein
VPHDWSCPRASGIRDGDRFFLLRHGLEPTGIIASGKVISEKPYRGKDTEQGKSKGSADFYIDLDFDAIIDPDTDPPLPISSLRRGRLAEVNWERPRSGTEISELAAIQLAKLWKKHLSRISWQGKDFLD